MKICNFFIVIFFIATLQVGCKHSPNKEEHKKSTIELNDGQKWAVNAEMTPYIVEAEQLLLQHGSDDVQSLAIKLEEKNNALIKSCTMDGKSHEELHKWLHPHIKLIESLTKTQNKEASDIILKELKASFQTYHTYFQ